MRCLLVKVGFPSQINLAIEAHSPSGLEDVTCRRDNSSFLTEFKREGHRSLRFVRQMRKGGAKELPFAWR